MLYFEPKEPILNSKDFTNELIGYKEKENNDLCIIKEGMSPIVELEGKRYICRLEQPRAVNTKSKVLTAFSFLGNTMGYKFVYFYPEEEA